MLCTIIIVFIHFNYDHLVKFNFERNCLEDIFLIMSNLLKVIQ